MSDFKNIPTPIFREVLTKASEHIQKLYCLVQACDVKVTNLTQNPAYMKNLVRLGLRSEKIDVINSYSCFPVAVLLCTRKDSKVTLYHDGSPISCMTSAYLSEHFPDRVKEIRGNVNRIDSKDSTDLLVVDEIKDVNINYHLSRISNFFGACVMCPMISGDMKNIEEYTNVEKIREIFYGFVREYGRSKESKIAICTLYGTPTVKNICVNAEKTKQMYCIQHGYKYVNDFAMTGDFLTKKYSLLLNMLRFGYDYVVWMNNDVFILNNNISIEDKIEEFMKNHDVLLSEDANEISTGIIILKKSNNAEIFVEKMLRKVQNEDEWASASNLCGELEFIKLVDSENQRKINSYYNDFSFDDFIVSLGSWMEDTSMNIEKIQRILRDVCPFRLSDESRENFLKRISERKEK